MLFYNEKLYDYLVQCNENFHYKTWTWRLPTLPINHVVTDPSNLEFILKSKFWSFEKGPQVFENLSDLLGIGIFGVDGKLWQTQRKVSSRIFHVKNFRDFFMDVFREELVTTLEILKAHAKSGEVIDIYDVFHRFTLDSFAKIGFGTDLGILDQFLKGNKEPVPFASAFDSSQSFVQERFTNPFWKITEYLDGTKSKLKHSVQIIDDFAYKVIAERRADPELHEKTDLLSRFIHLSMGCNDKNDSEVPVFNDKELRDIIMNLIIAGRDTTAQALSWCFYELFQHKSIFGKIRMEIDEKLPNLNPYIAGSPSYDEIMSMDYTKSVFNETLRLHPSVPVQLKVAVEDITLPDETYLKKGSNIFYSSYLMGRMKNLWGEDSFKFKPERFVQDPKPNPYKFLVFNAGQRLCLGMNMAYLEAVLVLSCLLKEFEFELAMPLEDVKYRRGLTLLMKNGLKVRVHQRNDK